MTETAISVMTSSAVPAWFRSRFPEKKLFLRRFLGGRSGGFLGGGCVHDALGGGVALSAFDGDFDHLARAFAVTHDLKRQIAQQIVEGGAETVERCVVGRYGLLAVHGALHLLGYDHAEPEEEAAMWARQDAILAALADSR